MTTSSDELNVYLQENSVPYDNSTELICINDMSKGGLPYYNPDEFNEYYTNYIYERIRNKELTTETGNHYQCNGIPNAIYLDGDWYFNRDVKDSDYSKIAIKLAKLYKKKWEKELNCDTVSFVFIPASFEHYKGGFHIFIFTEQNVGKTPRMEIYNRIKDEIATEIATKYADKIEVKSANGFVPVSVSNYETLFDRAPTVNMNTLLPFAEKYKASRRYILDLNHSSPCVSACDIPFFLNGVIYPERTENDDENVSLETFSPELEQKLEARYMELITRTYGDDLKVFGRKYGHHFAEFIRSLIYLSPNHRFWSILADHDDRLRYIFAPFLQILALSYFVENDGEIPNEDDLTIAAAKLIQPLLKTVARQVSFEKLEKYNFQYTVNQMKIAYEKFAHIQDKFTEKEREVYRDHALGMGKGNVETNNVSEETNEIQDLERSLSRLQTQRKTLKENKTKSIKSEKDKWQRETTRLLTLIKDIKNINYTDENIRSEETVKNVKIREITRDDSKSLDEKESLKEQAENEFIAFKTKYINDKVESINDDINKYKDDYETTIVNINEKFTNDDAAMAQEISGIKQELKGVKASKKSKEKNEGSKVFDKLQEQMIVCINGWIGFVMDLIMQYMTDEIKPFRCHNPIRPYAYTEDGLPNREDINVCDIKPQNTKNPSSISFYSEVLRTWSRHFLYASFYESRSSDDAICTTMTHFIKDFIFINNDDDNHETLIYNFQQTEELANYPYQQWILDKGDKDTKKLIGTRATQWIKELYTNLIKSELVTRNIRKGLMELMDLVKKCRVVVGNYYTDKELAPIANFDKGITNICNNLTSFVQTTYLRKPVEITVDENHTTFGRNGRIWFDSEGNIHYELKDNHAYYGTGYSNIIFEENYNKENDNYKTVENIFTMTFPVKEHRVFVERLISSVFVGGLHDVFTIMYGTGGEGKSVFCNLILSMMGSESIGRKTLKEIRRGKEEKIMNPHGLGGTMKSSVLLVSNNGGHDEDGLIHAKDKRFVIMQEPAKKNSQCIIHTDIIKEMTSGTETSARGIFGKQQSFIINMLPILQTNVSPTFDTDDAAVHRRVVVIPMKAKFYSAVNKERAKCEYSAPADPKLPIRIERDAYLAQAVFYYLLPRISEVIKNKWIPTSNIPRPKDIVEFTDNVFRNSTGLAGWFAERISEDNKSCVFVSEVINKAIEYQEANAKEGISILSKDKRKRAREVLETLIQKYESDLYKYKDEYCLNNGKPKDGMKSKVIEEAGINGAEMAQQKFMNEFPINTTSDSRREKAKTKYDDIILVGYRLDDIEENIEENKEDYED